MACAENTTTLRLLDKAEAAMTDHPDSALTVLRQVDASTLHRSATKARYALAYSQALDKNSVEVGVDSLIGTAVKFYRHHGSPEQRFLSLYYLGRVRQSAGEYQEAMHSYMSAEEQFPQLKNDYYAGLLYHSMGDLNFEQGSYEQSMSYYNKAAEAYTHSGRVRHLIRTLIAIARVHYLDEQFNLAEKSYLEAFELAHKHKYSDLESYCLRCLSNISNVRNDLPAAKSYMQRALGLTDQFNAGDYCTIGKIYLETNQPDSAAYYVDQIPLNRSKPEELIGVMALQAKIEAQRNRHDRAYQILDECLQIKDSVFLDHMNNSVTAVELQYKNERLAHERYRLTIKQRTIYGIIVASLFIFGALALFFQRRYRRQSERLAEYMSLIDNMNITAAPRTPGLNALFNARFSVLKDLARTYYEFGTSPSLTRKIKDILSEKILSAAVMEDLENSLNQEYNNVIRNFRAEYPKISPDSVELLCLNYAGFSPQEICVITNQTIPVVYMRKSRLKKKIATSKLPNKEAILKILS